MPNVSLLCEVPIEIRGNNFVTSVNRNLHIQMMQSALKRNFPQMSKDYYPLMLLSIFIIFSGSFIKIKKVCLLKLEIYQTVTN